MKKLFNKLKIILTALSLLISVSVLVFSPNTYAGETLDKVKSRGMLRCGINTGLVGFSNLNNKNKWEGFDVDLCRAVAAAVLDDPNKVEFVPLNARKRFGALVKKEIDVLIRNTTWTLSRDTSMPIDFTGISFYDGQGFLVEKISGINKVEDLNGKKVCVLNGTTSGVNLKDYLKQNKINAEAIVFDKVSEAKIAFFSGHCDAYTADMSALASVIAFDVVEPQDFTLLPDMISKEPLGPMVRSDDNEWFDIVKWVLYAVIQAEELGVNMNNLMQMLESDNPDIQRLLGNKGKLGQYLNLDANWALDVLKAVGNYGEIYDRNLGKFARVNIPRGLNNLWNEGGLIYAPPLK